jgi:hypothetical protein
VDVLTELLVDSDREWHALWQAPGATNKGAGYFGRTPLAQKLCAQLEPFTSGHLPIRPHVH